jgi:hypothetical protein
MPNIQARAEEIAASQNWIPEGTTMDATPLISCLMCGSLLTVYNLDRHARWHADLENMLYK